MDLPAPPEAGPDDGPVGPERAAAGLPSSGPRPVRLPAVALRRLSARCAGQGREGIAALREAGRAAGRSLHDELDGGDAPGDLSLRRFWSDLRRAAGDRGYGAPEYEVLTADVARVVLRGSPESGEGPSPESSGDAEPRPAGACHFTAGWLAGVLAAVAEEEVGVVEVRCAAGDDGAGCRFLVGAPGTVEEVRHSLRRGASVEEALEGR